MSRPDGVDALIVDLADPNSPATSDGIIRRRR